MCFILLLSPVFSNEKFCLSLRLGTMFASAFFYFFFHAFVRLAAIVHALCMNSSHKVWLFLPFFSQSVHIVHYSWTHKFHFSATFSLKMDFTVLFTHLKIILLQYFSVFSFSFQFSTISKRTIFGQTISF